MQNKFSYFGSFNYNILRFCNYSAAGNKAIRASAFKTSYAFLNNRAHNSKNIRLFPGTEQSGNVNCFSSSFTRFPGSSLLIAFYLLCKYITFFLFIYHLHLSGG
jgi:hypothetical protein